MQRLKCTMSDRIPNIPGNAHETTQHEDGHDAVIFKCAIKDLMHLTEHIHSSQEIIDGTARDSDDIESTGGPNIKLGSD